MRRVRLIKRRTDLNMTQEQVARAVGIGRTAYVRYETGQRTPPLHVAQRIAAVLQTTVDYLFAGNVPIRNETADDEQAALDAS